MTRRMPVTTMLADSLKALGRPGALLGRELDLMRTLGPRIAAQRARPQAGTTLPAGARADVYRRIWADAAQAVGATVRDLPGGFLEIRRGSAVTRLREQLVALDDPATLALAGDKPLVHALLADAGLPVPEHVTLAPGDMAAVSRFLRECAPCVVKPASGSGRGDGITGHVRDERDFVRARLRALRYDGERILLERQLDGAEFRVLVLEGEPIGAVRREPPQVVGDGASTVAELVEVENRRRAARRGEAGLWLVDLDLDTVFALRESALKIGSVPATGRRVRVRSGSSQGSEREAHTVSPADPSVAGIVSAAVRAAAAIGSEYASVEIMTPDPSRALDAAGGAVLEVNTTPGLAQHYLVADAAEAQPVARTVLERLLLRAGPSA